jgi:phage tail-like protein
MSARGAPDGLPTRLELLHGLPALYHDDFTRRFTAAFDHCLAPIVATIDNLESYVDPWLAPPDFLHWLASWVAITDTLPDSLHRRRQFVASAATLYSRRGTINGIRELITLCTGSTPEIIDNGATRWSNEPGTPPPGSAEPILIIRLSDPADIDPHTLEAIITAATPAHLNSRIQIMPRPNTRSRR